MGGIVGYWQCTDSDPFGEDLDRMTDAVRSRGPDGRGTIQFGRVGFGQLCLQTGSSREQAAEPHLIDGSAVVADARLDNRPELRRRLDVPDHRAVTDVELISKAYEAWGTDCADELLGAFAFVVCDRTNDRLFCVRDHMGVKPLYWWYEDGLAVFGSEIKALLAHRAVPNELFEPRIGTHLAGTFHNVEWTFYDGVYRLPAGNQLVVDENGARRDSYWDLDPTREIRLGSDRAYAERFRELFLDAVKCRMRGADPVGATLSGGLDSSAVACTTDLLNDTTNPVHTFSQVFDEVTVCDEREYIETVLESGHFESHYLHGDHDGPLNHIDEMTAAIDVPVFAPNMFLHRNIYRAAASEDVQVLLDGFDGDTTVSHGYTYLTELAKSGSLLRLLRQATEAAEIQHLQERSVSQILWKYVAARLAPEPVRYLWQKTKGNADPVKRACPAIDSEFAERSGLKHHLSREKRPYDPPKTVRESHYNILQRPLLQVFLEFADKVATVHGVEPRYPFFDKRLVEFCLAIPPTQKFGGDRTRVVMRRALDEIYPCDIAARTDKTSLQPNFEHGLFERNRELLDELLTDMPTQLREAVDESVVRESLDRIHRGTAGRKEASVLWRTGTLSYWLRQRTGSE
jgi:asparagine synthase (glutamine-hydrolysing)